MRRFHCPDSLRLGSSAAPRLPTTVSRRSIFGYGNSDTVIAKPELFAMSAWLDEHTFLTAKSYRGLDHSVSLDEFSDLRGWLAVHDIAPGIL